MPDLTRDGLHSYLVEIMNEVSSKDFSTDPENLGEVEKDAYYLRKGMSLLAREIVSRFELA